jgi:hypothetical protein
MTADDDRKVMMSVVVDFNSQESIKSEIARWTKLEGDFLDLAYGKVDVLAKLLSEASKAGNLDLHGLNNLMRETAFAFQDYGVAFATRGSLAAFGEYLSGFDQGEQS